MKRKLIGAVAMLLVCAVMLTTATFSWFVLSEAPEAKSITTTIGGNGYLEIALQSPVGQGSMSRAEPTSGKGDSLLNTKERNTKWGNVVEMNADYGLNAVTLYPSRLVANPTTQAVNTNGYLSIPEYGADGRIARLNGASFLTYTPNAEAPFTEGRTYGVNILGTVGAQYNENETITYHYRRSMIRDEAAGYLEEYRTDLRSQVIDLLESQQVGIFNIILRGSQLINGSGSLTSDAWTEDNVATGKTIIDRMLVITRESEASLKWALLALAVADDTNYPPTDETAMTALGTLYREFLTYPLEGDEKSIRSIAEANGYTDLVDALDSILRAENQLRTAKVEIYDPNNVSSAFLKIIDVQNTFLKNGSELEPDGSGTGNPATGTIHRIYEVVDPNVKIQGQAARGIYYNYVKKYYTDYLYFVGATPGPTTGLFSIMANLLGDYQATNQAYFKNSSPFEFRAENNANNTWKQWTMYLRATGKSGTGSGADAIGMNAVSKFNEATNRGVLGTVYDNIQSYDPGNAMISFSINKSDATAYGYSIDLAFRSNESCDLLLSQDALDRVLGVTEETAQGSGSDEHLMGEGSIASFTLAGDLTGTNSSLAKELMQHIYIVLTDTDSGAILGIVGTENPEVVLEQATAKLVIYEPIVTDDGYLIKGEKRETNEITSLQADQTTYITAIVFLNGDTLPYGAMSATEQSSLYGTINLQFASSAELHPMNYQGYVGG